MENKYCLYFHINPIKQEIFYVGIGNKKRPYSEYSRSKYWHNIVEKYNYEVFVVEYFNIWNEACEKEKYWINKIGRRDFNKGTLVNLTDGGDGNNNFSQEVKNKISKSKKGKLVEAKILDLSGKIFGKLTVINRAENFGRKTAWFCNCDCGSKNIRIRGENLKEGRTKSCGCILKDSSNSVSNKPVIQIEKENGKIINVFNSIVTASRMTNISKAIIHHFLRGKSKSGGGYFWKKITKEEYCKLINLDIYEK